MHGKVETAAKRPATWRAGLALAVLLASGTAMANGVYWIPGDKIVHFLPWIVVYEAVVVLVEWWLIHAAFGLPWRRALLVSAVANAASYVAGLPLGYALMQLKVFEGYALITVPQLAIGALLINWIVEAVVIRLAGRVPMTCGNRYRVLGINFVTWLMAIPFVIAADYGRSVPSHSRVSGIRQDMRNLSVAIEKYYVDHNSYPPALPMRGLVKDAARLEKAGGAQLMALDAGGAGRTGLTTPVAYITDIPVPRDNQDVPDAPYAYYADTNGWILFSPGGDGRYDILPAEDYGSSVSQPSSRLLLKAWDPTNGMASAGDIFRVKQ